MARTPREVRGSKTGRPIMVALDLLGRRWMLRVLWELRAAPLTFRALQRACGDPSPTVLNSRLRELRDAKIVEATQDGYTLSKAGQELLTSLAPLHAWAKRWATNV